MAYEVTLYDRGTGASLPAEKVEAGRFSEIGNFVIFDTYNPDAKTIVASFPVSNILGIRKV